LADRLGGVRVLLSLLTLVAGTLLWISSLPPLALAAVLLIATMTLLGMGNGAVFQLVPQRFPREVGALTGVVGCAGGVGGFLLPFALGLSQDITGTYRSGVLFLAVVAFVTVALLVTVRRRWQASWATGDQRALAPVRVPAQD
jgi:NNP family nitrate/nitrite transporter-like MFS transporter